MRAAGFGATLAQAGLRPHGGVRFGEWSERWGREAAARLLAEEPGTDAIFCGSDQIARGVADTLRAAGRAIPGDVALVGFDNWEPMALGAQPPLTSVDMCLEEVGRVAAGLLLAAIAGEPARGTRRVPCRLVTRQSSRARPYELNVLSPSGACSSSAAWSPSGVWAPGAPDGWAARAAA